MALKTAYTAPTLATLSQTANFSYALTIPGSSILKSGMFARVKLASTLKPQSAFVGRGIGALFDGSQVPMDVNADGWSDPVPLAITAGQSVAIRLDIPADAGQSYKYATGKSGFDLAYKSGAQGANNGVAVLPNGYTTMPGWAAMVEAIEVADTLEDFTSPPVVEPSPSVGILAELEARALANHMFAAGQNFGPAPTGKRRVFSLQIPADKTRMAFADMIELTLDRDSEVTLRAFATPNEAETFNSICNVNFGSNGPNRAAIARTWLTSMAPEDLGGRHTTYMVKAGQTKQLFAPRSFLGLVWPGGAGLALVVHEVGAAAHVSFEWHEKPI